MLFKHLLQLKPFSIVKKTNKQTKERKKKKKERKNYYFRFLPSCHKTWTVCQIICKSKEKCQQDLSIDQIIQQ